MKKIYFKTFGCRTNIVDTAVMQANLQSYEIAHSEEEADVIVVNSCTVTNGADSGVRSYVSQAKNKNPNAKILLTGCGVEGEGQKLFEAGSVFGIFGHSEKEGIELLANDNERFAKLGDKSHLDSTIVENFEGKSRAFLKVQEGCSFACSYCIIPSVRGESRSYSVQAVVEQAKILVDRGFSEFVLTGTNVGSYGQGFGGSLASLAAELSKINGVRRIRLGSIEPAQIDSSFLEILQESWLERHLHIALQHVHDEMLQKMNRRNRYDDDLKLLERIAAKGFCIGTDFIVGFPGESKTIWQETIERFEALPLTHLHGFVYSPREGTAAAAMKIDVRGDISKARLSQLKEIMARKNLLFREAFAGELLVLVEENGSGLDQFFNRVQVGREYASQWVRVAKAEVLPSSTTAKEVYAC